MFYVSVSSELHLMFRQTLSHDMPGPRNIACKACRARVNACNAIGTPMHTRLRDHIFVSDQSPGHC